MTTTVTTQEISPYQLLQGAQVTPSVPLACRAHTDTRGSFVQVRACTMPALSLLQPRLSVCLTMLSKRIKHSPSKLSELFLPTRHQLFPISFKFRKLVDLGPCS